MCSPAAQIDKDVDAGSDREIHNALHIVAFGSPTTTCMKLSLLESGVIGKRSI